MELERIKQEVGQLSKKQLEVRIQYTCEQMHNAYVNGDEILRSKLRKQLKIYEAHYEARQE